MRSKQDGFVPGVYWEKDRKTWRVHIERDGKRIYLGRRRTLEEATNLRRDAESGVFPADEEKVTRLFDKAARLRMRAVWRLVIKAENDWRSFDDFVASVGDRPEVERKLVATDKTKPVGPNNFQWVKPEYDHLTKDGRKKYLKDHRLGNRYRAAHLRKKFGITIAEYQAKLEEQKGVCAICSKPERGTRNGIVRWLNVDHNHETKAVRGLLCTNCNVAVGMMCESVDIMRSAISYLEKWAA